MPIESSLFPPRAVNSELVHIGLQVAIGATGAPTVTYGRGATIARTGVGDYTVTLNGTGGVGAILFANASLHAQSDLDRTIVFKGFSEANRTASFTVQAAAVPTEAANGDTIMVHLMVLNTATNRV